MRFSSFSVMPNFLAMDASVSPRFTWYLMGRWALMGNAISASSNMIIIFLIVVGLWIGD